MGLNVNKGLSVLLNINAHDTKPVVFLFCKPALLALPQRAWLSQAAQSTQEALKLGQEICMPCVLQDNQLPREGLALKSKDPYASANDIFPSLNGIEPPF